MGFFSTSEEEKKALKIEDAFGHNLGEVYALYDEAAIPYLEKWQGKKRPSDSHWTDDVRKRRIQDRSDTLDLIKKMKFADMALQGKGDITALVNLGVENEQAFYILTKNREDIDPLLIVRAKDELSKKLVSHTPANKQEKENLPYRIKELSLETAKGYAHFGEIDECTEVLTRLVRGSGYYYEHILGQAKEITNENTQKVDEKRVSALLNFSVAALKVPMRGRQDHRMEPRDKAAFLMTVKNDAHRSAIIDGLVASQKWDDPETAAILGEYIPDIYPNAMTQLPNSQQKALQILVDPQKFNIMGEDAATRLHDMKDKDGLIYMGAVDCFHRQVRNGITKGSAHVLDVIMPDLKTLDTFMQSYNGFAAASEPKIEPLTYDTLISSKERDQSDIARNKLMDAIFDAKVKDTYQAGQALTEDMQETMTLLGNLAGDVLIGGSFLNTRQDMIAGEFVQKLILTENADKFEGDKLAMMKTNMNDTPSETMLPNLEGEGAKILTLLANNHYPPRQEMAKRITDALKIEIKTRCQQQGLNNKTGSRYEVNKPSQ